MSEDRGEDRDGAREVRAEDAFGAAAVDAWLREHAADWAQPLPEGVPEVRQFPGGASNLTYQLTWGEPPGGRQLILRRPPRGVKAKSAHDMGREHRIQAALHPVFGRVPRMAAYADHATGEQILGAESGTEFYVMEKLEGTILRQDLPAGMSLTPEQARTLSTRMIDTLVDLHDVDVETAGLADLGRGPGYVARQVTGWTDRYARARTDDVGDFAEVAAWLAAEQPPDAGMCLIHNDYRFDNVVLGPDLEVVGLLDWELATVGDPLMDLGAVVAYWTQGDDDEMFQLFRRQPTHLPGMLTRAQVWDHYAARTGRRVGEGERIFYETFGLFRLAVIAQQIYYRYVHKQTTNPSFAVFGTVVNELQARCERLIATGDGNATRAQGSSA